MAIEFGSLEASQTGNNITGRFIDLNFLLPVYRNFYFYLLPLWKFWRLNKGKHDGNVKSAGWWRCKP
jgi:hypothetical protein